MDEAKEFDRVAPRDPGGRFRARDIPPRIVRAASEFRADLIVAAIAFFARVASVIWAGHRFPPTADGFYYHTIASRIAEGLGSTWLWPDGAVTYAAHYPIGYPAILALVYRWSGPSVVAAGF